MAKKAVAAFCSVVVVFVGFAVAILAKLGSPVKEILMMHIFPGDRQVAIDGCTAAQMGYSDCQVPLRDTGSATQQLMMKVNGIEAVINAIRRHQDDPQVMAKCISGLGGLILFNRPGGLRAGGLGAVELLMDTFRKWEHVPDVLLAGALGSCFDFVPENRRRFGELGGVELLAKLLDKHFWNDNAAREVWYAFSSGTYDNEERFRDAGMIEMGVKVMDVRGGMYRAREEVLQAFKPMALHSPKMRERMVEAGAAEQYVITLRDNASDPQVTSLVCENLAMLVGGDVHIWSVRGQEPLPGLNEEHRQRFTKLGAVPALLEAIKIEGEMRLRYNAFGYNVMTDCLQALSAMADSHKENLEFLLEAGAPALVASIVSERAFDTVQPRIKMNGCKLLQHLASVSMEEVKSVYPWQCPALA